MVNISRVFRYELLWNRKMPYLKIKNASILPMIDKNYIKSQKIVVELCNLYKFIACKIDVGSLFKFYCSKVKFFLVLKYSVNSIKLFICD